MIDTYLFEDDDITMDIQVGPEDKEIEVTADAEEAAPTPVDVAKANPGNIVVAAVKVDDKTDAGNEAKLECYVDARDVEKYAAVTNKTLVESLNDIIKENCDMMNSQNINVILGESTYKYARILESCGVAYTVMKEDAESDDINIDVQVGPNNDEISVTADPQDANPVDVVKKSYDSVVVAQKDKDFFVDVEDVQKCADLNCESAIDTLNHIIEANAEYGVDADNLIVLIKEGTYCRAIDDMKSASSEIKCMLY